MNKKLKLKKRSIKQQQPEGNVSLPGPMELAKLAAILEPNAEPAKGMKRAMEFFVEATCFLQECPQNLKELIRYFGFGKRLRALYATHDPTLLTDTLELDVSKYGAAPFAAPATFDNLILLGETHLCRTLTVIKEYHNARRPHR